VNYEMLLHDLHAARDRAGRLRLEAGGPGPGEPALALALEEVDVLLEELQVAGEEVRAQRDALDDGQAWGHAERQRYHDLFQLAPAPYLVTDLLGVILDANLRAAGLLGVGGQFVAGKPLASFVADDDRPRLRGLLSRLPRTDSAVWRVRLRPRGRDQVQVLASVAVGRDRAGVVRELRWLLWAPPDAAGPAPVDAPAPPSAAVAGPPALDDLVEALHEVASAAALLLRVDGAGLMLADQAGHLRWVTATGGAEQAFERAQRDLREGPCVDAFDRGEAVWTIDLRADPRWPRLAPAAAGNHIRGVLAVPVGLAGGILGTINAVTHQPHAWTDADAGAITALAAVTGRLLGSTNEARHRGDLVAQLQGALDSRVLVEQAKGVLMEREGLSEQAAFERLRRRARARSRPIDDVAREVIADRPPVARERRGDPQSPSTWRSPGPT
jgi:PAS domain S-box-containing protein